MMELTKDVLLGILDAYAYEIVFVDPFQVKTEDIALESIRQGLERLKQIL